MPGYFAALAVFLVSLFNSFFLDSGMIPAVIRYKFSDFSYLSSQLFRAFTLGLTVIVVAVPEGLPMMIAVVLSSNVRRMVRDNVLVRRPVGLESAGSMNLLFTDKTGTLTEGKMKVVSLLDGTGEAFSPSALLAAPLGETVAAGARFSSGSTEGKDEKGRPAALGGTPTSRAVLSCVLAKSLPKTRLLEELEFDSDRKFSAATLSRGGKRITFLLGAPEKLLPNTTHFLTKEGDFQPFSRQRVEKSMLLHTKRGARVLMLAQAEEDCPAKDCAKTVPSALAFVCAFVLSDPIRREAKPSVCTLQKGGVHVVMMTGDNRETARAIAEEVSILSEAHPLVLSGEELRKMTDAQVKEALPRLAVVSRALPADKSRLVRLAEECGWVVGMTGDGINDAPALRLADVGFAMGSGTQVAKDAGDVLILDNNLSSVVKAVLYGRTLFKSIRKFITLQLLMNFYAVGVTMICPFLGIDAPVTVVQMLWVNLIMDTLGGLAFAGEAPLPDCMMEPPKRRDEPILNRYMLSEILFLGAGSLAFCLLFLKHPAITSLFRHTEDRLPLLTGFFAFFIFLSVFNCFNARTDRLNLLAGLGKNPVFLGIMGLITTLQILFIYLGGTVLRTTPLLPAELLPTIVLATLVFPLEFARKLLFRRKGGY